MASSGESYALERLVGAVGRSRGTGEISPFGLRKGQKLFFWSMTLKYCASGPWSLP